MPAKARCIAPSNKCVTIEPFESFMYIHTLASRFLTPYRISRESSRKATESPLSMSLFKMKKSGTDFGKTTLSAGKVTLITLVSTYTCGDLVVFSVTSATNLTGPSAGKAPVSANPSHTKFKP